MLLAIDPVTPKSCVKCGGVDFYVTGKRGAKQCRPCHLSYNRRVRPARRKTLRRADPLSFLLGEAKRRANQAGIVFDISRSFLSVPARCPLLGIPLSVGDGALHAGSPTLDRILPHKGYVVGNVRVISHLANTMKSSASPEQLRVFAKNIEGYLDAAGY